jgi:MFS family permease
VIFGLAYGGVMPLYAVLVRDTFGPHSMGTTFGAVTMVASLGMALGPWAAYGSMTGATRLET